MPQIQGPLSTQWPSSVGYAMEAPFPMKNSSNCTNSVDWCLDPMPEMITGGQGLVASPKPFAKSESIKVIEQPVSRQTVVRLSSLPIPNIAVAYLQFLNKDPGSVCNTGNRWPFLSPMSLIDTASRTRNGLWLRPGYGTRPYSRIIFDWQIRFRAN